MLDQPNTIQSNFATPVPDPSASLPDHGSRTGSFVAWLVAILCLGGIVAIQQGLVGPKPPVSSAPSSALSPPPDDDPQVQSARLMVKINAYFQSLGPGLGEALLGNAGEPPAERPVERVRHAVFVGELTGAGQALKELDKVELGAADPPLSHEDDALLRTDIETLRTIYGASAGQPTQAQRDQLVANHAYFGSLANTFGLPNTDPARAPLVQGGGLVAAVFALFGFILIVAGLGGLVAFVLFIVRLSNGRIRRTFTPPLPGGSVYIETVALFFAAFILLQVVSHLLLANHPRGTDIKLAAQWLLCLVAFWPLVRGVDLATLRRQIGWHSGKGILREIGFGLFAYFAAIPLIAAAIAIAVTIVFLTKDPSAGPPQSPVQEVLAHANSFTLFLVFLLATIWAPLVEETIFRGALFRHLRGRLGLLFSATITALVFGFMHGYPLPLLLPVIVLGFVFSLQREWRGSLMAPITGHLLHNATLLTLGIMLSQAMK